MASLSRSKNNDIVDIVNAFNQCVRVMTVSLSKHAPTDAKIQRIKKRVLTASDLIPTKTIEIVGPYLYEYREAIYSGDEEFFLKKDYMKDLASSTKKDNADNTAYILPKMKSEWEKFSRKEKDQYLKLTIRMLDIYLDYLALTIDDPRPAIEGIPDFARK